MEVLKVALERETEEDGFELSLELSIGGSYGKPMETKKMEVREADPSEETDGNAPRSGFSCNSNKRGLEREDGVMHFQARGEERESKEREGVLEISNFSAASDHQSMSQKGGGSSKSGETFSNIADTHQIASRGNPVKRLKVNDSNSQTQPSQHFNREHCTKVFAPSMPPHSHTDQPPKQMIGLLRKPPKPPNHNISVRHMPCVSTTGNGPNGKTITGFLCKYTKTEVRIMCVCHGRFFSPAEFVEHAGGVGISNPLRHITIVDSAR